MLNFIFLSKKMKFWKISKISEIFEKITDFFCIGNPIEIKIFEFSKISENFEIFQNFHFFFENFFWTFSIVFEKFYFTFGEKIKVPDTHLVCVFKSVFSRILYRIGIYHKNR